MPLHKQALIRRLLACYRPYLKLIIAALVALVIFSLLDAGMVYLVKPLIDDGLASANAQVLRWGAVLIMLIFLMRGVAGFAANYAVAYVGNRIMADLRQRVFAHLQHLPMAFFDAQQNGKLLAKLTYDVEQLARTTTDVWVVLIRESLIIIVLLVVMFWCSWQLSLTFLLLIPPVGFIINRVSRRFRRISLSMQGAIGEISQIAEQSIRNHRNILADNAQVAEGERFRLVNRRNRQQNIKLAATSAVSNPLIQLIASMAMASVLYLASYASILTELTPGTFTAVLVAMGSMLNPIKRLTGVNQDLQRGLAAAQSIFGLLDEPVEYNHGVKRLSNQTPCISAQDLKFAYPDGTPALKGISFSIKAGQSVALVGSSGCGKSSLVSLLMRFYEASEHNSLFIDGLPVQSICIRSLREKIALVSQQTVLTDDSIANNIRFGSTAGASDELVHRAAQLACVTDFTEPMPMALHSPVGENGCLLSGGQRQRIAIARALLRDAPILILDEATSALDAVTENRILSSILSSRRQRTTLIITHRLTTLHNVDKILVFEQGCLAEQGTHHQLLKRQGLYKRLYHNCQGISEKVA